MNNKQDTSDLFPANQPYDQLSAPANLRIAWIRIRGDAETTFYDHSLIADYEQFLENNLYDLSARLIKGAYLPPLVSGFDRKSLDSRSQDYRIRLLEDLIVQQSARQVLEQIFEPNFLDCSFGFRPWRDTQMAVCRVLDYRQNGDSIAVLSGIHSGFGAFSHDEIIRAISRQVHDPRMINLIRMWLDAGLQQLSAEPQAEASQVAEAIRQLCQRVPEPVRGAIHQLLSEHNLPNGIASFQNLTLPTEVFSPPGNGSYYAQWPGGRNPVSEVSDGQSQILKQVALQFGQDALLVVAASLLTAKSLGVPSRELLKPKQIAVAASAVLAKAVYPQVSDLLKGKFQSNGAFSPLPPVSPSPPVSPLASLLLNITLHEFDRAMISARLHLVRYADSFAITAHNEQRAFSAYELAERRLREMRLPLDPQTTRIKRFDQGIEFAGYKFHESKIAAEPIINEQTVLNGMLWHVTEMLRNTPAGVIPETLDLGARAKDKVTAGLRRLKSLVGKT